MPRIELSLDGKVADVGARLVMRLAGGPFSLQLAMDEPVSLETIYDRMRDGLESWIGVELPSLDSGWMKLISIKGKGALPSLWIAPGSGTEAFYAEVAFVSETPPYAADPIQIGGGVANQYISVTIEPDIKLYALYLVYDKAAGGLDLRARIEMPTTTQSGAGTPSTQIVTYPFPVPPQGSLTAFQLHYIGLGQRVGPDPVGPNVDDPLETIFGQLERELSANDPQTVVTELAQTFYHPDRDWFFGLHVSMRGWDLKALFNDPDMYGLRVAANQPGTPWYGFLFEIFYQKVGPGLGVYYGALTLPMFLRRIEIDGVILVLPGFAVWIYTNGDFRVNVGWPLGPSSIGIIVGPLTGQAGFYFARLRSADNPGYQPGQVDYNPILEFGIALSISAGVSYNASIFSASLSASVTATLQGLLAWNAPAEGDSSPLARQPDLYWFAGTAQLVVVIQGTVDFAILKASVSIYLEAGVGFAFQTGYQTQLAVSAEVRVEVSVKILFVTIHLHFGAQVSHTFYIGAAGKGVASIDGPQGVWGAALPQALVASVRTAAAQVLGSQARSLASLRPAVPAAFAPGGAGGVVPASAGAAHAFASAGAFAAAPRAAFFAAGSPPGPAPIELCFALHPTAVYTGSPGPRIALVATLLIEAPAPGAAGPGAGAPQTAFEQLVRAMVEWLVSFTSAGDSWSNRFAELVEWLGQGSAAPDGPHFGGYAGFATLLGTWLGSLTFRVTALSNASPATMETAAVLPMLPQLELDYGAGEVVDFADFTVYGTPLPNYPDAINAFFGELSLGGAASATGTTGTAAAGSPVSGGVAESVFVDYVLMLARKACGDLQAAAAAAEGEHEAGLDTQVQALEPADGGGALDGMLHRALSHVLAHVQAVSGPDTLDSLLDGLDYAGLAGLGSRFLMHGLQLPIPLHTPVDPTPQNMRDVPAAAAFLLTGQQFDAAPAAGQTAATLRLDPAAGMPAGWMAFDGGDGSTCTVELPAAPPPAPSPAWSGPGSPGPAGGDAGAVAVLALPPLSPSSLTVSLKARMAWDAPDGSHAILPLPLPVLQQAWEGQGIQLALSYLSGGGSPPPAPAAHAALVIPVTLSRVAAQSSVDLVPGPGSPGSSAGGMDAAYVPSLYTLGPTDEQTRDLIGAALGMDLSGATLSLLHTSAGSPGGGALVSEPMGDDTLLVKASFSTTSRAGQTSPHFAAMLPAAPSQGPLSARLADVKDFLTLVWECSVVNGDGYYLYYRTADGHGLPDGLFAAAGTIQFDIVVELGGSAVAGNPVAVPPIATAIVVPGDGPASPVQAQVLDRDSGVPVPVYRPSYPPGTVGYGITWQRPAPASPEDPLPVDDLYQLFQLRIEGNGDFSESVWGLPVGPTDQGAAQQLFAVAEAVHGVVANDSTPWRYTGVVPVSRFLAAGSPVSDNPYLSVGRTAELSFRMADLFGNALPDVHAFSFPLRYNDPIVALGEWPGLHVAYDFQKGGGSAAATLRILLHFDPGSVAPPDGSPSPSGSGVDPAVAWTSALGRYTTVAQQLGDPNLAVAVRTSLVAAGGGAVDAGGVLEQLQAFVAAVGAEIAASLAGGNGPSVYPQSQTLALVLAVPFAEVSALPADVLPLTVQVELSRGGASPDDDAELLPSVRRVCTVVAANYQHDTNGSGGSPAEALVSLRAFAASFEEAFRGFDGGTGILKLAQRTGAQDQAGVVAGTPFWVVRMSPVAGIEVSFPPGSPAAEPVYLALRPLAVQPVTRVVGGVAYHGVDLDAWAAGFLADVEALLSPVGAAALSILDDRQGTGLYLELVLIKESLAARIPRALAHVFTEQALAGAGDLQGGASQLEQQLLDHLSAAPALSVLVQARAQVSAVGQVEAGSPGVAPRLSGSASAFRTSSPPLPTGSPGGPRQYAFSNPTLPLSPGEQWLNVFVNVAHPAEQAELVVPLYYHVTQLQHHFETGEEHFGYVPSSWLSFVISDSDELNLAVTGGDAVQVPIPLEAEPTVPVLVSQVAMDAPFPATSPAPTAAQEIEEALEWSYQVRVQHEWAAQDQMRFTVTYNPPPAAQGSPEEPGPASAESLFDALAAYRAAVPDVAPLARRIAAELSAAAPGAESPAALAAEVQAFLDVAQPVADAWPSYDDGESAALVDDTPPELSVHAFVLGEVAGSGLKEVAVWGCVSAGTPLVWPAIADRGGHEATPGPVGSPSESPPPGVAAGGEWEQRIYTFGQPADLGEITFTWTPLPVFTYQTGYFSAGIVRNAELVPGRTTSELFIYQTQTVGFHNPVIPLIDRPLLTPLAPGASLAGQLAQILEPLAGVGAGLETQLRIGAWYSHLLVADTASPGGGLTATTQILLATVPTPASASPAADELATQLAEEIALWRAAANPVPGGQVHLSLTLFGTVNGTQLPLVRLHDIPIETADGDGWWNGPAAFAVAV
ncbi:MAG TPA: hypothetical protein VGB24_18585 [Longimicrobium sp.]|jgi:hypothetical protein|uniref:hypothetical protein n=1 Tax=Longimicrobium sp. TaxID=2029185 RepID=UPI002EDA36E5